MLIMILLILTGTRRFQAMIMWSRIVLKRHKAGELVIVEMRMVGTSVRSKKQEKSLNNVDNITGEQTKETDRRLCAGWTRC